MNKYKIEYWLEKGFTEKESKNKVKECNRERSCWCKEYWIKRGFSEDDAILKVKEKQKNNNDKRDKESYKTMSNPYRIEYWMKKGFNEEESKNEIKKLKKKCNPYKKLNKVEIKNMIENRKDTYYSKTEEKRNEINKSRGRTKEEYIKEHSEEEYKYKLNKQTKHFKKENFIKKFGKDKYGEWRTNQLLALSNMKFNKHSKISLELFNEISKGKNRCYFGKNEKCLVFEKEKLHIYYVDFLYKNKIIEFYGDYFHGNPKLYKPDDVIGSKYKHYYVKEKWEKDKKREKMLIENGYDVLVIWESDYKKDKKRIIEICKEWIKNL